MNKHLAGKRYRADDAVIRESLVMDDSKTPVVGDDGKAPETTAKSPKRDMKEDKMAASMMAASTTDSGPTEAKKPASHIIKPDEDTNESMDDKSKFQMEYKKLPTLDITDAIAPNNERTDRKSTSFQIGASYGKLDKETIKAMDKMSKVIIAGTTRAIHKLNEKTWDSVLSCLMQNHLLEPMDDASTMRSDVNTSSQNDDVLDWFVKLINDDEIIKDLKIDQDLIAKIMSKTMFCVDDKASSASWSKTVLRTNPEPQEQTILDVGVLRYPDIDFPYLKFYGIKLIASSQRECVVFSQKTSTAITGEFRCMKFSPRESVIEGLRKETVCKAMAEAEALFR